MDLRKFLIIFGTSLTLYFVLDIVFKNVMIYIIGGIVGGTIMECFKAIGVKAGIELVSLTWMTILVALSIIFYRFNYKTLIFICAVLISLLLYVFDIYFGEVLYDLIENSRNTLRLNQVIIVFLILFKSTLLSIIVYFKKVHD